MKKLMFSTLACVAFAFSGFSFSGFASNEVVDENQVINEIEAVNEEFTIYETTAEFDTACKKWITHNKSCGGKIYFCEDNYASDEELFKTILRYDNLQCNGLAPTNPGTGIGNF